VLSIEGRPFPLVVTRHRRARRYLLRVTQEGALRLTVPQGGSIAAGIRFAASQAAWILQEWGRRRAATDWRAGTLIWHRGVPTAIAVDAGHICWGAECADIRAGETVRAAVERHLRAQAESFLVARCRELAAFTGLKPLRIAVRNQRSRWGSCSARGAVLLNWRLYQMPAEVCDYVILHELVHLEHPNHSKRFWRGVERVCPDWRSGERWLRRHGRELL
jgi:predicted metal-dependent hydrolase